jgi:hypothetical protein
MKKITFIALAAATVMLSACIKDQKNCCMAPPFQPAIVYELDGRQLFGDPSTAKVGADSISLMSTRQDAKLTMKIKYHGKGTYNLTGSQATYSARTASSNNLVTYNVYSAPGNAVEVTAVDSINKLIAGKFSVIFKKPAGAGATFPDSIVVRNGQFALALPQ